jgi:carboxyl-terminal processing protease
MTTLNRLRCVLGIATMLLSGCWSGTNPIDPRQGFTLPDSADYSALNRVLAFTKAHQKLTQEYALTDWKGIDWDALFQRHLAKVEQAASENNPGAYFSAVQGYLFEIDDGHVTLPRSIANSALIDGLIAQQSGASYGLGLAELDDGTVIVAKVTEGGSAASAGINAGAQILTWNSQAITAAISAVPLGSLAAATHMAVAPHQRLEQTRLLSRSRAGTTISVEYRNPGATGARLALLQARSDGLAGLNLLDLAPPPSQADEDAIISSTTKSGFGYIRLVALAHIQDLSASPADIWDKFQSAVDGFNRAGVPGLIVDIRGNHGGFDDLAADICGFFTQAPTVYEVTEWFDKRSGAFIRYTISGKTGEMIDALMINPQSPQFLRPVVVLVNPRTISSGEGLAKCINEQPTGAALGFHGTRGSFALAGGAIALPDGLSLHYPYGRSVDANGIVQLDSRNGLGGVTPRIRVPKTFDNIMAYATGVDVELRYAIDYLQHQVK